MSNKKLTVGLVIAVVIAIGLFTLFGHDSTTAGATLPTDGTVSKTQGTIYATGGLWTDGPVSIGNFLQFAAGVAAGSAATSTSLDETATVGTCSTGTSTPFSSLNPFTSTSTAAITIIGTGNATSTNLTVGTSTSSTGQTSTSVSTTLVNAAVIGTSTPQFFIVGGVTNGSDISAGSNTGVKIVVGPSLYVSSYATSTYANAGALNYSPSLGSCTYRIKWSN